MPRTTKGDGRRHPLNMRTTKETRERLEAAAAANGRSLAQEVEARIERSFVEEATLGGPVMYQTALSMVTAFNNAGRLRAGGDPDWNDGDTFRAAMFGVVDALLSRLPDATSEDLELELEALKGRVLTRTANR